MAESCTCIGRGLPDDRELSDARGIPHVADAGSAGINRKPLAENNAIRVYLSAVAGREIWRPNRFSRHMLPALTTSDERQKTKQPDTRIMESSVRLFFVVAVIGSA